MMQQPQSRSRLQQGGQEQGGEPTGTTIGQLGLTLDEALSGEMRLALHDFVQAAITCEWCANQCLDEGVQMAECVRLCRDVADLAHLNVRFIARDSILGPALAESFVSAAEQCAQECARHPHAHCRECASVLTRAATSTRQLLDSISQESTNEMARQQAPRS